MADREGHRILDPMVYIRQLDFPFPARMPVRPFHDATEDVDPQLAFPQDESQFNTCTEMVHVATLPIWDVNGYYRALGIEWPYRPTKNELMRAYVKATALQTSDDRQRLTYIFKRLINPVIRSKYDRRNLGDPIDDYYGWERVKELAREWMREQLEQNGPAEQGEGLTIDDYLESLGMPSTAEMEAQIATADQPDMVVDEHGRATGDWRWNFWLLRSARADTDTLAVWQAAIVAACAGRGLRLRLALGYVGATEEPWFIRHHLNHVIVFINESLDINSSQAHSEAIASSLAEIPPDRSTA